MERNEFIENYRAILKRAMFCSEKARREGLLPLEDDIDEAKANNRDIFEYGLRFVVDGIDTQVIDKILTNIINQEKDETAALLKKMQKDAVLSVKAVENTRILYCRLNSYTDIPFSDEDLMADIYG